MVGRIGHLPGEQVSCHSECLDLKQFERELLGQHRIADGKTTLRQETYPAYTVVACVELRDVHSIAKMYAVESASLATNHVEVIEHFKLNALAGDRFCLRRRKPCWCAFSSRSSSSDHQQQRSLSLWTSPDIRCTMEGALKPHKEDWSVS